MSRDTDEDTFRSKVVIKHLDAAIGSMSMSPANRDIVLGARSGLYILDLSMPWDVPRFLPGLSTWEVADVQWNIHPARAHWIVSTSGHQALVWNLVMNPHAAPSNSSVEHILTGHRRSVTDINWSVYEPDQLATCALDGWVQTWDLRTPRRPIRSYSGWRMGATQVKWNRQDPNLLASAHDGQVLVWDSRNGSVPIVTVNAHDTKIYGLDWSRKRRDRFITCSLDRTVKNWRIDDPSLPSMTIQTDSPVWRARYTPFGDGVLSLPQRAQTALTLWSKDAKAQHTFEGHKTVCKEFVWRTRGGQDAQTDDRDFQLVTWGRDCELHLWPVDENVLKSVGHLPGAPIEVRMTRRHYDNVSFRQPEELAQQSSSDSMKPAPGRSPMTTRGHVKRGSHVGGSPGLTEETSLSLTSTRHLATTVEPLQAPAGFVIRGPRAKGSGVDPIGWLTRISAVPDQKKASPGADPRGNGDLEPDKYSLGEEIAAAGRKFANRITFEKVQVGNRRCVVSCYGPWSSTNSMCFVRVIFHFPPRYPSQKPLRGDLISEAAHKTRSMMQRGLRFIGSSCMRTGTPALEASLRFLLGEKTEYERYWGVADDDSGDEEEDENDAQPRASTPRYNIPLPRQCGVCFGAHGEQR